jgi:hypothetical protein
MRIREHEHPRFVSHCPELITVFCSWDPGHRIPPLSGREVRRAPLRWTSAGTDISESDCVACFSGRDTHGGTPRRMANFVDNLRMSSPGGSSIEQSVSSSHGIDVVALTEMSRNGLN